MKRELYRAIHESSSGLMPVQPTSFEAVTSGLVHIVIKATSTSFVMRTRALIAVISSSSLRCHMMIGGQTSFHDVRAHTRSPVGYGSHTPRRLVIMAGKRFRLYSCRSVDIYAFPDSGSYMRGNCTA
ncbi:hypothetical protein RSAG8_04352, partial [Rhizoctonia solani AG-8 WAC10335]